MEAQVPPTEMFINMSEMKRENGFVFFTTGLLKLKSFKLMTKVDTTATEGTQALDGSLEQVPFQDPSHPESPIVFFNWRIITILCWFLS